MPLEANGDPKCVKTNGEPVPVAGDGDRAEANGDQAVPMESASQSQYVQA